MEQGKKPKRDAKGRLAKGESGNPGGRPKIIAAVRELAQTEAPEVFKRVVALTRSKDEKVALAACREVLDRALGKPDQAHKVEGLELVKNVVVINDARRND